MRKIALPTLLATGLAAAAITTSAQVMAYGEGDFFTRVGVAHVNPKSNNGTLADGAIDVDVRSDTTLGFTFGYRVHDKIGIELLAALPFEHDIKLNGDTLASTKHLPPTVTVQYYPLGGSDAMLQPYAGIGLNYTTFFSESSDLGDLNLSSSWGAAGQLGLDVLLDDSWALNAAAWYIDIDTDASLDGNDLGKVSIDPWAFMAGISYRF
ncbi:outer membrane beta-barrel protein [Halomonas campisalis]|uniref:Outer membrane beta-barrel protein n=1 Tax=Billgrantia campisalis TaxID=74661 RepID=A0ABS9PDS1_9GAMM|nr:OmpW family outer membrane protein [Halomonas campisalis]MCG6659265.1 outer membrane beta-barrel protein [Halomonas campisalis]MDR5864264.1 OmpW family outer membrane protein [Halomonas campisalis]